MFGIVPKPLWSKLYPPDEENRIDSALRALLIMGHNRNILVDTGAGAKLSEKYKKIYKVDYSKYNLDSSLKKFNLETKDITDVILTHLHFDHVGGSTYIDDGKHRLTFPNAVYYVQKTHYEEALDPNEKEKDSYHREDFIPIAEEGKLRLVDGNTVIFPNIEVIISDGHTIGQQLVKVSDENSTLIYCGDLIPTAAHIRLPYIAGYDIYPLTVIDEKKRLLSNACSGNWTLCFEHDPFTEAAKVERSKKDFSIRKKVSL